MSFIITVYTNEGIIMASDSRTTYSNQAILPNGEIHHNFGIQITDTTYKTFICNPRIGLSTCGDASIHGIPIAGFIENFISQKVSNEDSIEDVCTKLKDYFSQYNPLPDAVFIVAGYNLNDQDQHISRVFIATGEVIPVDSTNVPGAIWNGEASILQKLINPVGIKNKDGSYDDLPNYSIGFNFFTLQDAIDFAEYAVDVTIKTMSFQNCVKTVGGPIDILAIKPSGAFWIRHKELHA